MSEPIRVLFTIPNFKTAGGGQVVVDLCRHFDRTIVEPVVCVESAGGALEADLDALGVAVVEHPFTVDPLPRASLLARCRAIAGPLRGIGADVWHSWHYADDYTEPIVARMAGHPAWVFTKKSMAWRDSGWKPRSAQATAIVATNTDMVEQFFASPWLRRRAQVIPIGVDAARFAAAAPLDLQDLAGVEPGAPVVSVVARVVRGKSLDVAVRAMAQVPTAHLVIAGRIDNPDHLDYVEELRELIVTLGLEGRVHLVGHVTDVAGLLAASTLFVLPTGRDAEGCPVAVLEAMASGLACVVADTPGSRDVVADRRTGRVVTIDDSQALAAALVSLLDDPGRRAAYGEAGRRRIERDFTVERVARAHEVLYTRLAGRGPAGQARSLG